MYYYIRGMEQQQQELLRQYQGRDITLRLHGGQLTTVRVDFIFRNCNEWVLECIHPYGVAQLQEGQSYASVVGDGRNLCYFSAYDIDILQ